MSGQNVFDMPFTNVCSLLVQKSERKGRSREEGNEVIKWRSACVQRSQEIFIL